MQMETWVDGCRAFIKSIGAVPYLDDECDSLQAQLSLASDEKDPEIIKGWRDGFESLLLREPNDVGLRFAARYAFRRGGLCNPCCIGHHDEPWVEHFRYLAGLGMQEQLNSLPEFKFELHSLYLAANWERAEQTLARIASLELLPIPELQLLSGQFWFLSVFGRRIEFESDEPFEYAYDFWWPRDLPESLKSKGGYARPELLLPGSQAAWVLTAYCTNPRSPKAIVAPPEPLPYIDTDEGQPQASEQLQPEGVDIGGYLHDLYRDFEPLTPPLLSEAQRERLLRAVDHIQQGIPAVPQLASSYAPLLARSHFVLGQFESAADTYRMMIDNPIVFKEKALLPPEKIAELRSAGIDAELFATRQKDFEWELWFCYALCYRLQGNSQLAVEYLAEFRERKERDLPDIPESFTEEGKHLTERLKGLLRPTGVAWWIAKWLSEEGRYDEAANYLREELEGPYSPPESWQLSGILALGTILQEHKGPSDATRRYFAESPSQQKLLGGIIQDMWPTFASLHQDSQLRWLTAVLHVSGDCPLDDARHLWLNISVKEYGWVLEHELRMRIFDPFRSKVLADPLQTKQAKADYGNYKDDFYRFLFVRDPKIELGGMVHAIEQCGASIVQTDIAFARFLAAYFARLPLQIDAMKRATKLRNDATHGNMKFSVSQATEMSRMCRSVLDALR